MGGKVYDRRSLIVDRDPLKELAVEVGKLPKLDPAKMSEEAVKFVRDWLLDALKTVTGIDLTSIVKLLDQIGQAAGLGSAGGLQAFVAWLQDLFGNIDLSNPPTREEIWESITKDLIQPFIKSITKITAAMLGPLPIGLFTDDTPTLLYEGGFDDPITIIEGDGVEHDATDGVPGTTPLGCLKFTCDGTHKSRASELIKVAPNWPLEVGGRTKYRGLVAGADALRINIIPYVDEDTPASGGAVMVASAGTVSGDSAGEDGWGTTPIVGTWTVPAAGVTYVSVEPHVTDAATAGVAKFDEVYIQSTAKIPQAFTKDLPEDLASLLNFIRTWVHSALAALGQTPTGVLLDDIFDLSDEIEWIQSKAQEGATDAAQALANLSTLASNLLSNPAAVLGQIGQSLVENLEDDLAEAGDTIADVFDDVRDTWNKIVGGYRRTTVTGQVSADVEEVMLSVGQEILVAQESTITLANQANAPKNVPFWVSPNRFEEVSFARALLQPQPTGVSMGTPTVGTPNPQISENNWNSSSRSDYNSHRHSVSVSAFLTFSKPVYTIDDGTLALSVVTMTQDRLVNVVRFIAAGGTPPSTALLVGLYSVDPATGATTLVHDFGDQKGNINVGPDLYETALALPNDMLVDAGAMFSVGILPVGGSFSVAAIRRQPIVTAALIYPNAATELVTGLTALPASVADASMIHTASSRIWVSIGQAVESVPEDASPVTLTMKFNVADTSSWSSPSFQQYGNANSNFTVKSGNIYGGGPTGLFIDATYWRSALCLTPVHTNDHMAEITLGTGWDDDAYGYATDRAYVRCNSAGTSGVCLHVDATGGAVRVRIATITNLTSIGTVRVTATGIPYALGDRFSVRAVGNVYTVYRNDEPILDGNGNPVAWTDAGNIVPIGKAWRRTAFGSGSRATNGFNHYEPAHIDAFKAADLAA